MRYEQISSKNGKKREKSHKHQFLLLKSQKHHFWIDILFRCLHITTSISNFQHFSSSFQIFFPINDNFTNLWNHIYFPLLIVKIFWSCHCCTFTGNAHTMYTHMFFCEHLPTQYFFASYNSNAIKTLPTFIKPAFNVHASLIFMNKPLSQQKN